ncbi:MAG: nucleotide exchange factor GrpE, partial [Nitrospirota bacterium]
MSEEINNNTLSDKATINRTEASIDTSCAETEDLVGRIDSEVAEAPQPDDPVCTILRENRDLLISIKETIQNRLEYDAVKEKAIDKINDELKFYRDGFIFQSQKSIFIDLMLLYDSLERIVNSVTIDEVFSREKIIKHLEIFREELLEILYRRDITPFDEHPDVLNYKLHKTVKTIPTDNETENN